MARRPLSREWDIDLAGHAAASELAPGASVEVPGSWTVSGRARELADGRSRYQC